MKITMVKKQFADGSLCKKCAEVSDKLTESGYLPFINKTLVADENDSSSQGMQLAKKYDVSRAPFFIVENSDEDPIIYTVYFKLVKEILENLKAQQ